jgi:hypothetical protein
MGHSYRDLIIWQKAIGMVTEVYRSTHTFPREGTYGLTTPVATIRRLSRQQHS